MRPCGIWVGNVSEHKDCLVERFLFLPQWNFSLWHVTSSCFSRWRRGSSGRSPPGPGEGRAWLPRSRHSAAVGLQTREMLGHPGAGRLPAAAAPPLSPGAKRPHWMARPVSQRLDVWLVAPPRACLSAEPRLGGDFWRHGNFCWLSWVILCSSCS